MSETLVGESWPRQTIVGVLPLTSAEQWSHPRPLTRCDGHKPGLSKDLLGIPLLTSHASPAPCTAHGTGSGCSAARVYTEHPHWKLEIMATPWLSDIPSCDASVLAQYPALVLHPIEPSAPHSVLFLVLLLGSPATSLGWGSLYVPSSLTTTTA